MKNRLYKNASILAIGNTGGLAVSIALNIAILAVFGVSSNTDAYFVALTLPILIGTIFRLISNQILLPRLVSKIENEDQNSGWTLLNSVISKGFLSILFVVAFLEYCAPWIIAIQAQGFEEEKLQLSILIFRIVMLSLPILFISATLRSVCIVKDRYAAVGFSKFIEQSIKLIAILLLSDKFGILSLTIGFLAGATVPTLVYFANLWTLNYRPKFLLFDNLKEFYDIARSAVFPGISQFNQIITELFTNYICSLMPVGSITIVRIATQITDALAGVLGHSAITATISDLNKEIANYNIENAKNHLRNGIKLLFLLTIPACFWMMSNANDVMRIMYHHGSVSIENIESLSVVFGCMAPYVVISRLHGLLELPFFSKRQLFTPTAVSFVVTICYLIAVYALLHSVNILSIPIARSFSYAMGCACIFYLSYKQIGAIWEKRLSLYTRKIVLASLLMSTIIWFSSAYWQHSHGVNVVHESIRLFAINIFPLIVLVGLLHTMHILDFNYIKSVVIKKISNKKRKSRSQVQ